MASEFEVDDSLIEEACLVGEHGTKSAAMTQALIEYIQHHKQSRIIELFGTIEADPDYDYKRQRTTKR